MKTCFSILFSSLLFCAGTTAALAQANVTVRVPAGGIQARTAACVACHGKEGRASSDGYYPRIAGKPAGYLYNQMLNFRNGKRQYPMMTYMVEHLPDAYLHEIADYFAALHPPYPPAQPAQATPAALVLGRSLVTQGDAGRGLPACIACHGAGMTGAAPAVPGLLGLPRDYLLAQLGAWKEGLRHAAAPDCMALLSSRLSGADISAVASWLAAQPVPANAVPLAAPSQSMPLQCGSVPP